MTQIESCIHVQMVIVLDKLIQDENFRRLLVILEFQFEWA